jgi:excisionase family DNA binding protein
MKARTRFEDLPDVLTPLEAASAVGVSKATMYKALRRGQVPAVQIGRNYKILKSELLRLLGGVDGSPSCIDEVTRVNAPGSDRPGASKGGRDAGAPSTT